MNPVIPVQSQCKPYMTSETSFPQHFRPNSGHTTLSDEALSKRLLFRQSSYENSIAAIFGIF